MIIAIYIVESGQESLQRQMMRLCGQVLDVKLDTE